MNSGEYVDTERMGEILTAMSNRMTNMETAINGYNPTADSLGKSSFRGKVEENLAAVKDSYNAMIPIITEFKNFLNDVINAYDIKVESISNINLVAEK